MPLGVPEGGGVDRLARPFLLVVVGGHRLGAAAELLLLLGFLVLDPLIHLDVADELQGVRRDAVLLVGESPFRRNLTADVDEPALVGRVHLVGGRADHRARSLLEAAGRLDGARLVPEEEREGHHEEHQAHEHALDRLADPRKPGLTAHFTIGIGHRGPSPVRSAVDCGKSERPYSRQAGNVKCWPRSGPYPSRRTRNAAKAWSFPSGSFSAILRIAFFQLACPVHFLASIGSGWRVSPVSHTARSGRGSPLPSTASARQSVPSL